MLHSLFANQSNANAANALAAELGF